MNKVKKLYEKAMRKYENGYIDEAIDICEEIMSLSMKYKPAINLKGLLYYFKGDLKSASALWKLNYEVNNDRVAKKYLEGLKEDEERFSMYSSAIKLIRRDEVNEALKILIKCKESDYNRINIDNNIAVCYLKLKEYDKAVSYINKVLEIDIKNITANNSKKKLKNKKTKTKFDNRKSNKKLMLIPILIIILIAVVGVTVKRYKLNVKNIINKSNNISSNISNSKNSDFKKQKGNKLNNDSLKKTDKMKNEENTKIQFKYEELSKAIDSKDFNKIYELLKPWRNKENKLDVKDKTLLVKGEDILKDEGVKCFYNTGRECLEANDKVDQAVANLQKAYDYGSDSYLYGHILFMLGVSYENKKDINNALKCYEEYEVKYPKENYIQEVLYRTAILYKNVDLNKSKEYAKKLIDNYPDCEYSNSKIKAILNK
ncbi:hypothetical protein Z962_07055 [Clostridium botulinum C/D str. BKT12695]|nr:hypothetical protein Z962_07055 [Clostridium botulinum C/D str. BKT12695]